MFFGGIAVNDNDNSYEINENEGKHITVKRDYDYYDNSKDEKKDKLNDIVITQCILCLAIAVGVLVLNICCPDISRELIEKYKHYSGTSDNDTVSDFVSKAIQAFNNLSQ